MDQFRCSIFLAWFSIVLARPQELEDTKRQCSSYFPGEPLPLKDEIKERLQINAETENLWKKEFLTYR